MYSENTTRVKIHTSMAGGLNDVAYWLSRLKQWYEITRNNSSRFTKHRDQPLHA